MTKPTLPSFLTESKRFNFEMVAINDYIKPLSGSGINGYVNHYFIAKEGFVILNESRRFCCNSDINVIQHLFKDFKDHGFEIIKIPYMAIYKNPEMEKLIMQAN